MENKKNRLTSIQKLLLDTILKTNIFENIILPKDLSLNTIDANDLKKYNDIHSKINTILVENNIEPHEILNLIENYQGNHQIFEILKKFIMVRNICVLKRVYGTDKWTANIKKIEESFNVKYKCPKNVNMTNLLNGVIIDILIKDIKMFDITQCRLELDSKYNLKIFKFSFSDQKHIISKLLESGCLKI